MTLNIGDSISGTICDVAHMDGYSSFFIDIDQPGWQCQMQWNSGLKNVIDLLKLGDPIEGWIIGINRSKKSVIMGISDFGKYPPKPNTLNKYFDALLHFKAILKKYSIQEFKGIESIHFSEMKGLISRSSKKDQWDWYIIFKAFGFVDDAEVFLISNEFNRFSEKMRNHRKGIINEEDFIICEQKLLEFLAHNGFLDRINNAISYLSDEAMNWEITRVMIPSIRNNNASIADNQIIHIGSHIRRGVAMSRHQMNRIIEKLENCNIQLTDGTLLTKSNFGQIDWSSHTIVYDYEREYSNDELETLTTKSVYTDLETNIKKERANIIHEMLVNTMSKKVLDHNLKPLNNALIDLFVTEGDSSVIFEMKSIHNSNECSQIRKAISQLYEYRFIHNMTNAELCIVLNKKPIETWIIEYVVRDRNILICWLDKNDFYCPGHIVDRLFGVALSHDLIVKVPLQ